ncbi:DEAD/DEAH box helicase family protein [Erythrobacter sp. SCSIO 43205]|uniref:DEAD/DEAH box helicase family protein n=1 Tax=Erythrobacter sp. SCSIO 43205 TaxID=2779361 RepID=UPI001CA8BE7E|nr:DEAD/DEAH box helicase family protein [Erythrobacter sp. SCSIO 43205]UAB78892.1 DEAD/DEAH box helicase family protein [Erythrobacter sp. SCSIO 43205]
MQFSGVWRDYQARVLAQMEDHLGDDRLHVVAAPGAGKTVLGLEIVRRLARPALVFAPSLAIRDQWRERLSPLFMNDLPGSEEISCDLREAKVLTLSTYQSLDSFRRSDQLSALIEGLNASGPFTLVLDEAHHLRKAWWDCLNRLANELEDLKIVALTATPPYDASFAEWNRYERLCGPIDLEIGIPELVRAGDLCPHQDHLTLSRPTADALELLNRRAKAIYALQRDLREDTELLQWLESHPWLTDPESHVEQVLEAPEMLSSVLVLLGSAGHALPPLPLKLLGVKAAQLPRPSQFWLEQLLDGLVFIHREAFPLSAERYKSLERRLHREGLIEGKRVRLSHTRSIFRLLASSLGKMESICEIASREEACLGKELRMVVLSDHIRASELPRRASDPFEPAKLGVIPIFETLRRKGICVDHLAVLTGSLVIVPAPVQAALAPVCEQLGLELDTVRTKPMPACPAHLELTCAHSADATRLVTALFQRGDIRILVGTQSLLGQGWDAPALNSLVLASNTASFVLSNQMRGRAIRIDPHNPDKVSNIWHLATIEPRMEGLHEAIAASLNWGALNDDGAAGPSDIATIARRFRAFECISNGPSDLIESGLGRLGLDARLGVEGQNAVTFENASDRPGIAAKWVRSLGAGEARSQVRETAAPNYAPRTLAWKDTLHALAWTTSGTAGMAFAEGIRSATSFTGLGLLALGAAGVATAASFPSVFKAARLLWRNGSLEGSLEQVGRAILECLSTFGLISAEDLKGAEFEIRSTMDGRKDVIVKGVSRAAERQILQAFAEVLGPVQNPRYLLSRKSWLGSIGREDYHAVPASLGARKEIAEMFAKLWNAKVGSSKLIFTRSADGRRFLLRARMRSFAAGFQRSVDRRSAWL